VQRMLFDVMPAIGDVAFGGKADMTIALHMSANDPKRTFRLSVVCHYTPQRISFKLTCLNDGQRAANGNLERALPCP
jgi:hypothetical protein